MSLKYPSVDDLIELNKRILKDIKVKKADQHLVLLLESLRKVVRKVGEQGKDVYDKAAILLMELARTHHFASGNRRTAFLAATSFLEMNGERINPVHDPKIIQGIRERFYTKDEIKHWLKGHEIKPFKRT